MGLGWQRVQINNRLIIDKNGGVPGYSSYIGFLPEEKIGIVILVHQVKAKPTKVGRKVLLGL
jgi:beta-lactamase class C